MQRNTLIVELFFVQLLIWRRKDCFCPSWNKSRMQISSSFGFIIHFISFSFGFSILSWFKSWLLRRLVHMLNFKHTVATLSSVPLSTGVSLTKITVLFVFWLQPRGISETIFSPEEKIRRTEHPKNPRKTPPESIEIHTAIIQMRSSKWWNNANIKVENKGDNYSWLVLLV